MKTITRVTEYFFFVPLGGLMSLLLPWTLPTQPQQYTLFGYGVCACICLALAYFNVATNSKVEERLFKVVRPVAALSLILAAACGVLHYFGA